MRWFPDAAERLDAVIAALAPSVMRTRIVLHRLRQRRATSSRCSPAPRSLAYPSLYEGFGFPVLEAFAAGVPVLTSNVSSLPEVAGDAAVLVDPADVRRDRRGLCRQLFGDADLAGGPDRRGRARASRDSPGRHGSRDRAVLRGAAAVSSDRAPDGPE